MAMIQSYIYERQVDNGPWVQIAITADLSYVDTVPAEGVQVRYRAKAIDDQGAEGPYITGAYKAIDYNNPPVISGADTDLGAQTDGFSYDFSITDEDGDAVWFYVQSDGEEIMRVPDAVAGQTYTVTISREAFLGSNDGAHALTVTAFDAKGASTVRTVAWSRTVSDVDVIIGPIQGTRAEMPTQITVDPLYLLTADGTLSVLACNNAFDDQPTWEDMTASVVNHRVYLFTNTEKSADAWGVKVRVRLLKGNVPGILALRDVGGSFK